MNLVVEIRQIRCPPPPKSARLCLCLSAQKNPQRAAIAVPVLSPWRLCLPCVFSVWVDSLVLIALCLLSLCGSLVLRCLSSWWSVNDVVGESERERDRQRNRETKLSFQNLCCFREAASEKLPLVQPSFSLERQALPMSQITLGKKAMAELQLVSAGQQELNLRGSLGQKSLA